MMIFVFRADLRDDERELLNCGDDDTLAVCNCLRQIPGMLRPNNGITYLHKLFNGIPNLLVENAAVGNHDNRVNHGTSIFLKADQLMGKPSDGIGLAASGTVLDQILLTHTVAFHISQQLFNHIQLMVSGKNLLHRLLFCLRVHFLHNLRIVLNDPRQLLLGQDILPKIVCHDAIRVRRVACTVIVALVKWQEPAVLAAQLGAEFDPCIVQRKMNHASFEGEQSISRVSVGFVLLHRVIGVLLCELVFQLKGDYRQSIDKNTQVQSQLARILGITELTGHAENVLFK